MAELRIRLDIGFSRSSFRWALVSSMLLVCAPELGSETVTLSTYYPAPSGVYTKMITTGDAWLARDGGMVRIGSNNPGFTTTLDVKGGVLLGRSNSDPAGAVDGAIYYNNGSSPKFMGRKNGVWAELGGGGPWTDSLPGVVTLNDLTRKVGIGTADPKAPLDVNGLVVIRPTSCNTSHGKDYTIKGVTFCPGGHYATSIMGVLTKNQMMPLYSAGEDTGGSDATGRMFCCPCPALVCPSL